MKGHGAHRLVLAGGLSLLLAAGCATAPEPAEPPAESPPPASSASEPPPPPPPPPPERHDLSVPVEGGEAEALEREAAELRREAEAVLTGIGPEVRRDRREEVEAIRSFLEQSRAAEEEGDLELARNLARKARDLAAGL